MRPGHQATWQFSTVASSFHLVNPNTHLVPELSNVGTSSLSWKSTNSPTIVTSAWSTHNRSFISPYQLVHSPSVTLLVFVEFLLSSHQPELICLPPSARYTLRCPMGSFVWGGAYREITISCPANGHLSMVKSVCSRCKHPCLVWSYLMLNHIN